MKILEILEYKIPEYYLPLIFNSDFTGLNDEEIKVWDKFEKREELENKHYYWEFPNNYEAYFSWSNDINKLGGNVVDLKLFILG